MKRNAVWPGACMFLILLFVTILSVKPVSAWLSDQDHVKNVTAVGNNDVEIPEEFPDPHLKPGKPLQKVVRFENTGRSACYVRAVYFFSGKEAQDVVDVLMGPDTWKEAEDGYYYYDNVLEPGEITEPLVTGLQLKEGYDLPEDFDLAVYTETVQAAGHENAAEAFASMKGGKLRE